MKKNQSVRNVMMSLLTGVALGVVAPSFAIAESASVSVDTVAVEAQVTEAAEAVSQEVGMAVEAVSTELKAVAEVLVSSVSESEATHAVVEHDGKKEAGLPQFDFTTFPSQIFWLTIFFGIMYVVFGSKTLPAISTTIENRRRHVQSEIENSERMADEARLVQTQYEQRLEMARQDAGEIIAQTDRSVKQMNEEALEKFRGRFDEEVQAMEQSIENAKTEIYAELKVASSEIAVTAIDKVSGLSVKADKALAAMSGFNDEQQAQAA